MTIGIKYISDGRLTGYALGGLAYIRALHNAGVPVWPFFIGPRRADSRFVPPLARAVEGDASLADMPAILRATARPIAYDTLVLHAIPELWARFAEAGRRCIGYTAWETEGLPEQWPALLDAVDLVLVPSRFSAQCLIAGGVRRPVRVVPHIRRHAWGEAARRHGMALRQALSIPADHYLFYTIGAWDPRKAMGELIDAFVRGFGAADRVCLLIKTSASSQHAAQSQEVNVEQSTALRVKSASRAAGHAAPLVLSIAADDVTGQTIEAIHAAGDAYVSLSHGEGWGLGAFDAATLGKPVIITGWGGQIDFLGEDYPGLVRYRVGDAEGWRPTPHSRGTHRWATADAEHAIALMRAAVASDARLLAGAAATRERILSEFAEDVVVRRFLDALNT